MKSENNILLVRVPEVSVDLLRGLRDLILESLSQGILVLPEDASCEVLELPALGSVNAVVEVESLPCIEEENTAVIAPLEKTPQLEANEKQIILRRLKDYRAARGPGCLAAVSTKTARRKDRRISDDILRQICANGAPKLPIENWRSIGRALDILEQEERGKSDGNSN